MKRWLITVWLVLHAAMAVAQTEPDLANMQLEDLMRIEVQRVFGASDRLQPVTEAPSSVTIVTRDEIERYGYRTLADILRSTRGFYVSNDRNYSYLGARGFARPGDYNTRILLLIDGHRLNDDVYDQAPIGSEFGIDVSMFERVEIIRGPASSMYGTSAFFAVVNAITRSGSSFNGVHVDVDAGTLRSGLARLSGGTRLPNGVDFALSGAIEGSQGQRRLYFPEFDNAGTNHGLAEDLDAERVGSVFGHLTVGKFTFTGTYGRRSKDVPTASFGTLFNEQATPERTTDRHTTITGEYTKRFGTTRLNLDGGFDRYDYDGVYPFASDNATYPLLINNDGAQGIRWNAGIRVMQPLRGRHTLTAGGLFFDNVRQNQWSNYNDPAIGAIDLRNSSTQAAAYLLDEFRVQPWLLLSGGMRWDEYYDHDGFDRATPRAAVIVSPQSNYSFKYLYGEAFRAPNAYELYYYGTSSDNLTPEFIRTHEVVWEQYLGEWLRASASAYRYNASRLITFDALENDGYLSRYGFHNDGNIDAHGVEFEAEIRTKRRVEALTSYVVQTASEDGTGAALTNSPRHVFKARGSFPLLARSSAAIEWQILGHRSTLAGNRVPIASVINTSAAWRLTSAVTLTGSINNMFNDRYWDPGSDEHLPDAIQQDGRTARIGLRWTIAAR